MMTTTLLINKNAFDMTKNGWVIVCENFVQRRVYFGIALRQTVGNLKAMEDAIMASLFHVSNFHQYCPTRLVTVGVYTNQQDKINGTKTYEVRDELPVNVREVIFPIYKDMGNAA